MKPMADPWPFNLATPQQGSQRRNDGIKQLLRMGEGQLTSSKPLLAACTFSKVLEMQDDNAAALTGRAMALLMMGMPSSALVDAQMALMGVTGASAPPAESLYVKACALRDLGQLDLATPVFAAALSAATDASKPPAVLDAYQAEWEACRAKSRHGSDGNGQLSPRGTRNSGIRTIDLSSRHKDVGEGRQYVREGPLSARPHYAEPIARNGGGPTRGRRSSGWGHELISLNCPAALDAIAAAEHAAEVAEFVSTHLFSLLHPSQAGAGPTTASGGQGDAKPLEPSQAWLQRLERRGSDSHIQHQAAARGPLNLFQTMAPMRGSRETPWAAATMGPQGAASLGPPSYPHAATMQAGTSNGGSINTAAGSDPAMTMSALAMNFPAPAWGDSAEKPPASSLGNHPGPSPGGPAVAPSPRTRNLAEAVAAGRASESRAPTAHENGGPTNGATPPPRPHPQPASSAAGSLATEFLRASHGETPRDAQGGAAPASASSSALFHAQPAVLTAGGFQLVTPESSAEQVSSDSSSSVVVGSGGGSAVGSAGGSAAPSPSPPPAHELPASSGVRIPASKPTGRPITATVQKSATASSALASGGPSSLAPTPSPPSIRPLSAAMSTYGSSSYVRSGSTRPLTARTKV
eukprot:jgi/Mesvir1/1043/Mv17567-RA.1